jgi:hypothetical protein
VLAAAALLVLALQALAVSTGFRPIPKTAELAGDVDGYRAAIEWVRTEAPTGSVLLVDDPRLCATWTERRAFFETKIYSPHAHVRRPPGGLVEPSGAALFREHERLESSFFAAPIPADLLAIRALVGPGVPLYALRSNLLVETKPGGYHCAIRPVSDGADFGRAAGAQLVHDAGVVVVYRLPD